MKEEETEKNKKSGPIKKIFAYLGLGFLSWAAIGQLKILLDFFGENGFGVIIHDTMYFLGFILTWLFIAILIYFGVRKLIKVIRR